jgi:hypothetical protein
VGYKDENYYDKKQIIPFYLADNIYKPYIHSNNPIKQMPDTFTHIALPALFSRYLRSPIIAPLFLIGTVLPDYFREFFSLVLPPKLYPVVYPFHSLLGIASSSLLITAFFKVDDRKSVFFSIVSGQLIHIIFDLMQSYLGGSQIYVFFPSRMTFEFGFFAETHWIYLFCLSSLSFSVYIIIHVFKKIPGFADRKKT